MSGETRAAEPRGDARARPRTSRRSEAFALALLLASGGACATGPLVVTKRVDGRVIVTRPIAPAAYEHVTRALLFEEDNRLAEAADELERALTFDDEAPEILAHLAELDTELGKLDEAQAALQRAEQLGATVEGALAAAGLAEARHDDATLKASLAQAVARADEDQAPQHVEDAHLAQAAERLGALDADGAFATLQALVQHLPTSARGRRQLAAVAWAVGKMADAEAQLTRLLEEDANDLDAQLLLATLLAASDRPREAKAAFEQALSRSEEALEIAEIYLRWLMDRGDVDEARRLADALVVSDPTSGEAAERTCRVERAVRRPERAKAAADNAKAHGAPAPAMTFLAAEAEKDAGHKREAAKLYREVAKDSSAAFESRLRAADLLAKEGDPTGATAALNEASALPPAPDVSADEARVALAMARSQAAEDGGRAAEAAKVLQTALAADRDSTRLSLALAGVEERRGNWQLALDIGQRVLARDKRSVEALNFCGFVAADHAHDLPKAVARLVSAAALDPGNGAVLDSLGWAAFAAGDLGKATPFLRQAAQLDPADPEILSHVAALETRLGSRPRALEVVKRALALSPEPRVRRQLEAQERDLEGARKDGSVRPTTRTPR